MPSRTWRASFLAGSVLAGVIGVTLTGEAAAQQKASPPDFSANQAGWITMGGDLLPVPDSPKPITRHLQRTVVRGPALPAREPGDAGGSLRGE